MDILLKEFLNLYLDHDSNNELVYKIHDLYINLDNYKYSKIELERLILLKKDYNDLIFILGFDNYFSEVFRYLSVDSNLIIKGTIFHELTHLLHWNGYRKVLIDDFNSNIDLLLNKKVLNNYVEYSNRLKKRISFLNSKIDYMIKRDILYKYGNIDNYYKYLYNKFCNNNSLLIYYENSIVPNLVHFNDFEDYKREYLKLIRDRMINNIIFKYLDSEGLISDLIDGLYNGRIGSNTLKDNTGNKIYSLRNHNENYYKVNSNYDEVLADFGAIIKSLPKYKDELINLIGIDLYEYIKSCYEKIVGFEGKVLIK